MTTTPQSALLKRRYLMSGPHLSGYRVIIGFATLEDAQNAHEYIAKLQAATPASQRAVELPDERAALRAALRKIKYEAVSLGDAQVIALEALSGKGA